MYTKLLYLNLNVIHHVGDFGKDGRIILKRVLDE
jgi:hypothetical protein